MCFLLVYKDQNVIDAIRISYSINKHECNPSKRQVEDVAGLKGQVHPTFQNVIVVTALQHSHKQLMKMGTCFKT